MELYYTFSVLIVLASAFAYINLRWLKFPSTIIVRLAQKTMLIPTEAPATSSK